MYTAWTNMASDTCLQMSVIPKQPTELKSISVCTLNLCFLILIDGCCCQSISILLPPIFLWCSLIVKTLCYFLLVMWWHWILWHLRHIIKLWKSMMRVYCVKAPCCETSWRYTSYSDTLLHITSVVNCKQSWFWLYNRQHVLLWIY